MGNVKLVVAVVVASVPGMVFVALLLILFFFFLLLFMSFFWGRYGAKNSRSRRLTPRLYVKFANERHARDNMISKSSFSIQKVANPLLLFSLDDDDVDDDADGKCVLEVCAAAADDDDDADAADDASAIFNFQCCFRRDAIRRCRIFSNFFDAS